MNDSIFYFFYNFAHQSTFVDNLIIFLAVYFPYIVIVLAMVFLLIHKEVLPSHNPFQEFKKKWKEVVLIFFTSGFAWVIAKILKNFIQAERPFSVFPDVQTLLVDNSFAFPSGHATFFMALAVGLFFYHKNIGYLFMFFALIITLARVAGGVHFPIDILGGFALGALVAFLFKNR